MGQNPAWDIASANVGDDVALADGRTVTIEGVCVSTVTGNSILINGTEWLDASLVVSAAG